MPYKNPDERRVKRQASDRAYRARNRDRRRAYNREYNKRHPAETSRRRHSHTQEWRVLTWERQDGMCYLCGDAMDPRTAVIDHDHSCCDKGKSCAKCRRGLAHSACNALIGLAAEDPARLRRIADNLEQFLTAGGAVPR